MKPRNAREREVVELHKELPELTPAMRDWIRDKVVDKRIYTSGKSCWCSRCGGEWTGKIEGEVGECPRCGNRGKVERGRKRTGHGTQFVQTIQTFRGWQVIRYTAIEWYFRKGAEQRVYDRDVIQKWCQPGRPTVTLGAGLSCYPWNCEIPYSWYGGLMVKEGFYYGEWMKVKIYPRVSLLPVYRKNIVLKRDLLAFDAEKLLANIFSCPYLEALFKAGKTAQLKELVKLSHLFNKYWPSVRVAVRHGYEPEDWISYFDYLKMLRFLHYDMRSPRYVAPPDWQEIHERVMTQYYNRLRAMQRRRHEQEALRRAQAEEERMRREEEAAKKSKRSFARRIAKFKELCIEDKTLVIRPLMSIKEFMEEGKAMNHCVFRLGYYKKPDSLILSARKKDGGERVETIEVNLNGYTVWQSRGVNNMQTKYHDEIVGLVMGAMPQIREMAHPKKKTVSAGRS